MYTLCRYCVHSKLEYGGIYINPEDRKRLNRGRQSVENVISICSVSPLPLPVLTIFIGQFKSEENSQGSV